MINSKLTKHISSSRSPLLIATALLYIFLSTIFSSNLYAQPGGKETLDSLLRELPKAKEDTNKMILLRSISIAYMQDNYDQAIHYAKQSLQLAEKLKISSLISASYYFLGNMYMNHSDYIHGLECMQTALKIEQVGGDKEAMASLLNNMAAAYLNLGDHAKAIDANLKALQFFEDVGNQYGMANCHINISSIFSGKDEDEKALGHLRMALKHYTALANKRGIALALNNIGAIDTKTKKYDTAKAAFLKALSIYEEIHDSEGIDMALINVAEIYNNSKDYKHGLEYAFKALQVARSNDMPEGVAYDCKTISSIYYNMATDTSSNKAYAPVAGKSAALKLAGTYADSAIKIFAEIGMLEEYAEAAELSAKINVALGNYKEAYEDYQLFKTLNDSVFNIEKDKKITQSAMQYDFDKKEAAIQAEHEKKNIRQRNIRNSIIVGLVGCLVFLVVVYRQRNRIAREKARSEELLLNILPEEVAEELKEKGSADARHFDEVTVMFTDFKGFTQISEKLTPAELVEEIHTCFKAFDQIITKYDIEKIKTIGDAYMCAGGLPVTNTTNAIDVVRAALEIQQFMQQHLAQRKLAQKEPFEIRIGIHTGPVVAGIVGVKKFAYDIWGDTVNTASRMESSGEAGKVNISGSTYAIVKDTFNCTYRGKVHAKGKGEVDMYFVDGLNG